MAHVRRTPNGTWEARYRAADGKERSRRFPTKRAARDHLDRVGHDRQVGTWTDPVGGKLTYAEWVGRWTATEVALRPSSRARDDSYLRTHLLPRFGPIRLAQIGHFEVREWVTDLTAAGLAPATVHKAHQILNKSLRAAVEARLIPLNPAERTPLPRIERREMRFLDPAEIHRLAAAVPDRYRAMILLDAYCGLRLGELAGLRRRRLDLPRQQLRIAEIAVEVKGELTFGPPKTNAGTRTVPLPRFIAENLADHVDRYAAEDGDALVFAGSEGGALRARAWRQRVWLPAIKKADVAPLRPHDLRRTAVSLWIAPAPAPSRLPSGPGTPASASSSTATATCSPATPSRSSNGSRRLPWKPPTTPPRTWLRTSATPPSRGFVVDSAPLA